MKLGSIETQKDYRTRVLDVLIHFKHTLYGQLGNDQFTRQFGLNVSIMYPVRRANTAYGRPRRWPVRYSPWNTYKHLLSLFE